MIIGLIGLPNSGKSTLANYIAKDKKSLVSNQAGTTIDLITHYYKNHKIIDTMGYNPSYSFAHNPKLWTSMDKFYLIIDGSVPITEELLNFIKLCRKNIIKPIIPVVNKIDNLHIIPNDVLGLGLGEPLWISGLNGNNVCSLLPNTTNDIDNTLDNNIKISIIGKSNVGKSSLLNLLGNSKFSLVKDEVGTTVDCVDGAVSIGKSNCNVIDTPGLCKKFHNNYRGEIEKNIFRNLDGSDVAIIMFDDRGLTHRDGELISYCDKNYIPYILVLNKRELCKTLTYYHKRRLLNINYISCHNNYGIHSLRGNITKILNYRYKKITTSSLNKFIHNKLIDNSVKIKYICHISNNPHTFLCNSKLPPMSFVEYMKRILNQEFFPNIYMPLKIIMKKN